MRRRQRYWLCACVVVGWITGMATVWPARAAPTAAWPELKPAPVSAALVPVHVGKNVHASASLPTTPHLGCALAADPTNPRRLFAAATLGDGYDDIAGYYSHDGGATWHLGCKRPHAPGEQVADEDVAFGPEGHLFFVNMRVPRNTPGRHRYGTRGVGAIDLARSLDGGKTWEERTSVPQYIDRPCLAVDRTAGVNRGRLYIHANVEEPLVLTSADEGRTVSEGLRLQPPVRSTRPSNPVVRTDGTVLVAAVTFITGADTHQELPLWGSADGGRSFTLVTRNLAGRWQHPRIKSGSMFDVFYPRLAVDPGSPRFAGRVYCVWRDGHASDETYILFARSRDGGATWSAPVIVSEQPAGVEAGSDFAADIPALAVNGDGVIAVSWYDRRGLPKHTVGPGGVIAPVPGYNARLRVSCDGGETWQPSARLNATPMTGERLEARHWMGLTAADGRFHAAWIGDATGKRQVWTSAITVGSAAPAGR